MELNTQSYQELLAELEEARRQLNEANDTIEAIRTGQIDALVVENGSGHQLYTLKSADIGYRVFIEKMTEGAVTLNPEGIILYCNSQFALMVGLPISAVIGQAFKAFISKKELDVFQDVFRRCWQEDCKEEMLLCCNGIEIPVLLSLTALEIEAEKSLSLIVTDLTILKKNQQLLEAKNRELEVSNRALESSNQDLQQFASVASHDLQEPLRKIQMFSELLRKKEEENRSDESRKFLDKITSSAARMKSLVIDILNYSGLSVTDTKMDMLNLHDIIAEVLEDLGTNDENDQVIVGTLPLVRGNAGQIRQVFQNMLSNALKFVAPGVSARVEITGKRIAEKSFDSKAVPNGPYALISIRDNGIGFDEQYLDNIFNLFERLHSKDVYEGTGIGLALTKKIIDKHNGLITANSKPGEGAEFRFVLPV